MAKRITFLLVGGVSSFLFFHLCFAQLPEFPVSNPPEFLTSDGIPVYGYEVINTFPHDSNAFTQGLVFENGVLYEGTGLYGSSTLRKVGLETGDTLEIRKLADEYFGEGITIYKDTIIQLTWKSQIGFVYIEKDTFELIKDFSYPTQGWGITHNGTHLIMSDGSSTLHFLNPETFEEVHTIEVRANGSPVNDLNELEYIQGKIYANVWYTDLIAIIHPQTGEVVGWIDLEGLLDSKNLGKLANVLNGIAYDADNPRLFVTGKWWPKLFEIEVTPLNYPPAIISFSPSSPCIVETDSTLILLISTEDPDPEDSLIYIWSVNGVIDSSAYDTIYHYASSDVTVDTVMSKVSDGMFYDSTLWIITVIDTLPPQVTVISPDSGEIWLADSTDTIRWKITDDNKVDSISIYLSLDGGSSYPYTIAQGISNDSAYPCTVMDTFSTTCRVKVIAWDTAGNNSEDESNYDFVIAYGEKGNVNGDGEVNILDLTRTIGIIQGYEDPPISYELWAADIKEDGEVNILDIVVIVHRIQGKGIREIALAGNPAIVSISCASGIIGADDNMVYVNLENQIGVTGIQIRIGYDPLLLAPREARTTSFSDILNISSTIDTNYIQMLLYSTSLNTIASDNRTIIGIPFYISPNAGVNDSTLLHIEYLLLSDVSAHLILSRSIDGWLHFGIQDTDGKILLPKRYELSQAHPNPAMREVTISYQLPDPTEISLRIYDATGKLVKTMIETKQKAGYYSVVWDIGDSTGKQLSSGIYFYRLETPKFTATKKLIIVQ